MIHEVVVAAVSAAVGAGTVPLIHWLRGKCWPKKWEPFEPGVCDELPLHEWDHGNNSEGRWFFWCPVCKVGNPNKRPPYCSERGGHFHFKCHACGYEWAMRRADYKPPAEPIAKTETVPPLHVPGDGMQNVASR